MAALLKNLFAGMGTRPNALPSQGTGITSPTLVGRPTPIPTIPAYNPLGKKKPTQPTPIPGVPSYGSGPSAPSQGRSTLLGGGLGR